LQQESIYAAEAIHSTRGIVNPNSIYCAFREGRIKGHKDGHRIIFERASWEKWLDAAQMKRQLAAKYTEIRGQQSGRRLISLVA